VRIPGFIRDPGRQRLALARPLQGEVIHQRKGPLGLDKMRQDLAYRPNALTELVVASSARSTALHPGPISSMVLDERLLCSS
jgi:hypothetical protein